MISADNDSLKQLDDLLTANNQSWLFGAGISVNANIPLMDALTARIFSKAGSESGETLDILNVVKDELPENFHIEHILSQLADYMTIATRCEDNQIKFESKSFELSELQDTHQKILEWIGETIRWGYVAGDENTEQIGDREQSIVKIDEHEKFVSTLFNRSQAGISNRRNAVRVFTLNYDTLLEDALALGRFSYWDGFSGGAVAYRSYHYGDQEPEAGYRAHVIKLHGSIDWYLGEDEQVRRVRDGDLYPGRSARVLIYPQATKYLATQRDPFAAQFDLFRRTLCTTDEHVLVICGYSFGDEHINAEIELALNQPGNKTTVLAFAQSLNPVLESWRRSSWGKRLYVITENGLYVGDGPAVFTPATSENLDWWTFGGVTRILNNGAEVHAR